MREIWGPVWLATALCVMALLGWMFDRPQAIAPAFFCFLPVVFFQMARTVNKLTNRVAELESQRQAT